MSDQEGKKPGRNISDLKARLGMKKGEGRPSGAVQAVPPPRSARITGSFVPPPPGVAPPEPIRPAQPDARNDPFGAMNAIAAANNVQRAPEIIVVDHSTVEKVHPQGRSGRYAKLAGLIAAPLILGFLLGGINYERRRTNATLGDAQALYTEFQDTGKQLEKLNNVLLVAKERGPEGKAYAPADTQLTTELEGLNFNVDDDDKLIVYHANLYNLDPKLVQDTLVFYGRLRSLSQKVKEHIRLTKDLAQKMSADDRAKMGLDTQFGIVMKLPTADEAKRGTPPGGEMVQLGSPVCTDGKPSPKGCAEGALQGYQIRSDTSAPWAVKPLVLSNDAADKVLIMHNNNILAPLMLGSQRFLDEMQYYQRLSDIDILVRGSGNDGGLIKDRKDIEDRMNVVAQRGKLFAL